MELAWGNKRISIKYNIRVDSNLTPTVLFYGILPQKSVSDVEKGFPTVNFIVISNYKYYYERINAGNRT